MLQYGNRQIPSGEQKKSEKSWKEILKTYWNGGIWLQRNPLGRTKAKPFPPQHLIIYHCSDRNRSRIKANILRKCVFWQVPLFVDVISSIWVSEYQCSFENGVSLALRTLGSTKPYPLKLSLTPLINFFSHLIFPMVKMITDPHHCMIWWSFMVW